MTPQALPDIEVVHWPEAVVIDGELFESFHCPDAHNYIEAEMSKEFDVTIEPNGGWYYWHCLPGCMPVSDPIGPFTTADDAVEDARGMMEDIG